MDGVYRPRARRGGLLVEPIGEELLVYDEEERVAHSLNEAAARVWRACDGERDLAALMAESKIDRHSLVSALELLRDVDLLEPGDIELPPPQREGISRRAMLRRSVVAGAGIGVAIPVIRSITAPSIAMAGSGRTGNQGKGKAGYTCTSSNQCSAASTCRGGSCQRNIFQSCSHTSSCSHAASGTYVCRGGICNTCTSNGQCPSGKFCHSASPPMWCE